MISVIAPYDLSDVTLAALQVANSVIELGEDVCFLSTTGVPDYEIDTSWDAKVRSGTNSETAYAVLRKSKTCIFFGHSSLKARTDLVAANATKILVPTWHQFTPTTLPLIASYDIVVCPSQIVAKAISTEVFDGGVPQKNPRFLRFPFDGAVTRQNRKPGLLNPTFISATFLADQYVIDFCPSLLLESIRELLSSIDDLRITLVSYKAWRDCDKKRIKQLSKEYPIGFSFFRKPSQLKLEYTFSQSDWVVLPAPRANFSTVACASLACGAPVICYDISPLSSVVINGQTGILIPCEINSGLLGAPTALFDLGQFQKTLLQVLPDTESLFQIQSNDWYTQKTSDQVKSFWKRILLPD